MNKKIRFEKIIKAATKLFKEKNFHGVSIQEIADVVGIYKGSLYYYISSKEELLFYIINQAVSNTFVSLSKIPQKNLDSTEILSLAIHNHIKYIAEYQQELSILIEDAKHLSNKHKKFIEHELESYGNIFNEIIKKGTKRGEFRDVNPRITSLAILGMCNWIYRWFSWEGAMSPEQIGNLFADMILTGLKKKPFSRTHPSVRCLEENAKFRLKSGK